MLWLVTEGIALYWVYDSSPRRERPFTCQTQGVRRRLPLDHPLFEEVRKRRHVRARRGDLRIVEVQVVPLGTRLPRADVHQIGARAHRAQQLRRIMDVVAGMTAAGTPASLEVRVPLSAADLLRAERLRSIALPTMTVTLQRPGPA